VLGSHSAPTAGWQPVCRFAAGRVLVHVMSERTAGTGWIARDRTRPMRQKRMYPRTGAGCLCKLSCRNYAILVAGGAAELPGLRC
jgi:hypothetical protein